MPANWSRPNNGLHYKFKLMISKTTMEGVNRLNLTVLLTYVNVKKLFKFGSESVLYAVVTIAPQCPPIFTGWREGYGLQQYNYCIAITHPINVWTET